MRKAVALALLLAGVLYLTTCAGILLFTRGGSWHGGPFTIKIHHLWVPIELAVLLAALAVTVLIGPFRKGFREEWKRALGRFRAGEGPSFTIFKGKRIIVLLFLLMALGVRAYKLDVLPLEFHKARQYNNALIARSLYCGLCPPGMEPWKKNFFRVNEFFIEPPLMELLAVGGYFVLGGEHLALPGLLSALLWLAGSWFLYRSIERLAARAGALAGTAYYLFLPFAIRSSRCFMPDPLMTVLVIIFIYYLTMYLESGSRRSLLLATLWASLAVFAKCVCIFTVSAAFAAVLLFRERKALADLVKPLVLFTAGVTLPLVLYGTVFLGESAKGKFFGRFFPALIAKPSFYIQWFQMLELVVGIPFIAAGLLALFIAGRGPRALLGGLIGGYGLTCLFFSYHSITHDYYHMLAIPLIALALGQVTGFLFTYLSELLAPRTLHTLAAALLIVLIGAGTLEGASSASRAEGARRVAMYERIGEMVNHSRNTIILDSSYGLPLKFHGWIEGTAWPTSQDFVYMALEKTAPASVKDFLFMLIEREHADYFIITSPGELEKQKGLRELIEKTCSAETITDSFLIYRIRR
ncbi:MAG: glycosyltransferase family 39 protein [Candidatus Eremiobacteraeota bacterium]|nr:glycosyltransferase family 39 protein [Candidatus Eremiobacteraeota bacterium]